MSVVYAQCVLDTREIQTSFHQSAALNPAFFSGRMETGVGGLLSVNSSLFLQSAGPVPIYSLVFQAVGRVSFCFRQGTAVTSTDDKEDYGCSESVYYSLGLSLAELFLRAAARTARSSILMISEQLFPIRSGRKCTPSQSLLGSE